MNIIFCVMARQPPSGPGPSLITEASLSHSNTPHLARLLWTSDQSVGDATLRDNTQHPKQTFLHPVGFDPTVTTGKLLQTHALDRAAIFSEQNTDN
jgi:hypothetical protein